MAERQTREEKMSVIQKKLEEGVVEIFTSEKYREYMDAMSKFPRYSVNNCILIASQYPQASLVCGFRKWKKEFNRTVNKGEHGIMILAPIKGKTEVIEEVFDENNRAVLDEKGNQKTEIVQKEYQTFRPVYVFDVSQTSVIVAVVNAEKNAAMLKKVPHRMVEDLAVIYKLYLGSAKNSISTITVRNDFLKRWGITPDELHEHAMKNSNKLMPARVRDMESILRAGFGDLESLDLDPLGGINTMYVITNAQKVDGAASIIYSDALERTAEMVGTDLYILPSSIHETIAISADCCGTPEELAEMVKEINTYQVDQEEQLSDHVYKYDAQTKTLSLADVSVEDLKISRVSENKMSYGAESTEPVRPRHHR